MTASRFPALLVFCATMLCMHVSSAAAQTTAVAPLTNGVEVPDTPSPSVTGPRWNALPVAVQSHTVAAQSLPSPAASSMGHRQSTALMIVGGAGILVGALIGGTPGTVFMVGGAVVGLYGLYEYLQ